MLLWTRENRKVRELPAHHRYFVTGVHLWTVQTVLVNLIGKFFAMRFHESHVRKKLGDTREQANTAYAVVISLFHQSLYQNPPHAESLQMRTNAD